MAVGVALIVGAAVVWVVDRPEPAGQSVATVGQAAAEALASGTPASPLSATTAAGIPPASYPPLSPAPLPSISPSIPSPPGAATPATVEPTIPVESSSGPFAPAAPPARLIIDSLGVDAEVLAVGVDANGAMEIPKDVSTVGWYRFGPAPGDPVGSAVLTGHVDDREQGPGAFARIGDLAVDDVVLVRDAGGFERRYTVLAREEWSKGEAPLDRLFDRGGGPRLVLITCGGDFDASIGHYEDNIAITAVPVG